jgi:hypothetical protein
MLPIERNGARALGGDGFANRSDFAVLNEHLAGREGIPGNSVDGGASQEEGFGRGGKSETRNRKSETNSKQR